MTRWILSASAALLLCGSPAVVWANGAPPPRIIVDNKASKSVKFIVEIDDNVKEPRLEVPQGLLAAENRRGDAAPRVPIFVVGVALTASFVSGGLWLSRRGRNRAALVVALGMFALSGGMLLANAGIPRPRPPVELALPAGLQLPAKLTLQVTEKGDAVKLIVPSGMVLKTEKQPTPKPEPKSGE